MEIYSEEKEAPKDDHIDTSIPVVHPSYYQEKSIELVGLIDILKDVAVTRKRPAWLRDTLQDEKGMNLPMILSERENDIIGSRVTWSHTIDSKPFSYEEE
jgi:hypothetical protein